MERKIKFSQSARKHRIGHIHCLYVMNLYDFRVDEEDLRKRIWVGRDVRNRELEIVALDLDGYLLVIHVAPTKKERKNAKEE